MKKFKKEDVQERYTLCNLNHEIKFYPKKGDGAVYIGCQEFNVEALLGLLCETLGYSIPGIEGFFYYAVEVVSSPTYVPKYLTPYESELLHGGSEEQFRLIADSKNKRIYKATKRHVDPSNYVYMDLLKS